MTDSYVNRIIQHPKYKMCLDRIAECEKERIFCHHDMVHFLDVARLAWIFNLQNDIGLEHKLVYGAALLHDVGRYEQYEIGTPHEIASARIAPDILQDCGYLSEEIEQITEAIRQHRNAQIKDELTLRGIIYRADKMSRSCFSCKAIEACDHQEDKKNKELIY